MPTGSLSNSTYYPTPWDQTQGDLIDKDEIQNQWELMEGICVLPVALTDADIAAGASPVAIGRLHPPYRMKNVRYAATKNNAPPILPSPVSSGAFVFVGGSLRIKTPTSNQTYIQFDWDCAAEYTFVENVQSDPNDGFVLTTPAWQYQSQVDNANALGGDPQPPQGAIKYAGNDAKVAWAMAQPGNLDTSTGWQYPACSYYPGSLFNDQIINGATLPTS